MATMAVRIQAPPDRNGNSRTAWVVSSHGENLAGFIMIQNVMGERSHGDALFQGIEAINLRNEKSGEIKIAGRIKLDPCPRKIGVTIPTTVRAYNDLKRRARDLYVLVGA